MIETNLLQILSTVAKVGSYSKAAEELDVTQSAVSQNIKNLETKVGVKLLQRSSGKYILTQEGERLNQLAEEFLNQMDEVVHEIREVKDSMSGKVRVGTLSGVGKSWLAHQMVELAKAHEDLRMDLYLGFQEELVSRFERNELDLIIIPESHLPQSGEKYMLSEESSILVFPKHFDVDEDITMEDLLDLPLVLFEKNDPLVRRWCREKYGKYPRNIRGHFVMNSHGNMLHAVSQGLGVAVIPQHVFRRSFHMKNVGHFESGEFTCVTNKFYLVYHKESMDIMRVKAAKDYLIEKSAEFNS
jgi:DNA-binding transcriptional LysR family regulator